MTISVITVTFNSERTIRDTIESVLRQTYRDVEYIIIDGASKDGTLDIIKGYEPKFAGRMRYISEPDDGIYYAMNKGIEMSSGDVIGFLNSDDIYYDTDVLSDIAHVMVEKEIDCVFGDLMFVYPNNKTRIIREWKGSPYRKGIFNSGWMPAHPTFYVRKGCYSKYGCYDTSMKVSADFDLMMRFLEKEQIPNLYIKRRFVIMSYGGKSTGSILNIIKGNKSIRNAFKKNGGKVPKLYYVRRLFPKFINLLKMELFNKQLDNSNDSK